MEEIYRSPAVHGQEIHRSILRPEGPVRGAVLALHGWGDHLGTHGPSHQLLLDAGYLVVAFDWPGNGKSFGKRGHLPGGVATAIALIDENFEFIKTLPEIGEQTPSIYAHSTGGFFILCFLAAQPHLDLPWLWLSSPLLRAGHGQPDWKTRSAKFIARYFPAITFDTHVRARDTRNLSPLEIAKLAKTGYYKLCHHRVSAELGADLIDHSTRINQYATHIDSSTRLLITQGTADAVCPLEYTEELFEQVPSNDKHLAKLDGLKHEPFNEPENESFVEVISQWLH